LCRKGKYQYEAWAKFDLDETSTVENILLCSADITLSWTPEQDVGTILEEQYEELVAKLAS
jgi:hypothetical protein